MFRFFFRILFLGCFIVNPTLASSYYATVEKISVSDGLPDTTVYSLAKDKKGFLWLGTPTALARYDGYGFRVFSKQLTDYQRSSANPTVAKPLSSNNLVTNSAANIFIDSQQRIWIGTWGEGLALYDSNMNLVAHFVHDEQNPNSIGSNMVQTIFEDSDGDIWIGSNGGGVAIYRPETQDFVSYRRQIGNGYSLSHNRVWSIAQTSDGHIWLATSDGLNRYDKKNPGHFLRFRHDPFDQTSINHVLVRVVHAQGMQLWIGTESGFGRFDTTNHTFSEIRLLQGKLRAAVTSIRADRRDGLWIGTQKGLFRYELVDKKLTPLVSDNTYQLFPHNDVRDLLFDEAGVLWVATRFAGVLKINLTSNNFSYYRHYSGNGRIDNSINKVYAIYDDKKDGLWLGMDDGLLRMNLKTQEITRFSPGEYYSSMHINSITAAKDGTLWLGGPTALATLNIERNQFKDQLALLQNVGIKHILNLLMDSRGDLWIGTSHEGLLRYDSQGQLSWFQHDENDPDSISGNGITALFEDQLNRIWIGTNGKGANRYDDAHKKFVRYGASSQSANSLNNDIIEVIYQTQDSVMWFGTPKSLSALDDSSGTFHHYGEQNGMSSSNIKGIIEDDHGDLWISTVKGITQFKRDKKRFFNFTDKDSLSSNDFLKRSVAKGVNGHIYFGNNSGFHEVQPDEVKVNQHIPNVVITDIWVDNKRLDRYDFKLKEPLILTHEAKSIRLQYAALDFLAPSKNLYQFKLDGFDEYWSEPSNMRHTIYTSLDPGHYTFAVKGSNNSNQWSEKNTEFSIIVKPAWWRSWWAISLGFILLGSLAYAWYRYRLRSMAIYQAKLEQKVALRTEELQQQKNELMDAHQQLNAHSEALKQSNKELFETLEQTAKYQDELVEKEKMAALGKMVAGIAHEINTPIGLGVTATTLMQDRMKVIKDDFKNKRLSSSQLGRYLSEGEESLSIICRNLDRAAELISSFKQVSVDQSSDESRRFDMSQLIDEVLLSLKPNLKPVKHKVVVKCDKSIRVKSKPGALSQILINFISNSLIHAFDSEFVGTMSITVDIIDENCHLVYGDNGRGVSEDMEARIFEPFATSKRGEGGSGLGMHLVYNLSTQALGGSITMENKLGEGVTFTVVFPIKD